MTDRTAITKRALFVLSSAPYGTTKAMESLDSVLTAAAFDLKVTVLVLGAGVWQVCQDQKPALVAQKPFIAVFAGLESYDIEEFFVAEMALAANGLNAESVIENCEVASLAKVRDLFAAADLIIHG